MLLMAKDAAVITTAVTAVAVGVILHLYISRSCIVLW